MATKQSGNPRLVCPKCKESMKVITRPPKLSHIFDMSSLSTVYCVCTGCGRRGHAEIHVKLHDFFLQDDWTEQAV